MIYQMVVLPLLPLPTPRHQLAPQIPEPRWRDGVPG
jgi:hypothetical protein